MRKRELLVERSQRYLIETQLSRIAATLKPLRKGVNMDDVLEEIVVAILRFTDEEESQFGITIIELDEESITVGRGKRYASKGRPPRTAKRSSITTLRAIYENATGRRIGRNVPSQAYADRTEKPHPFLAACMKAAGTGYSRRITRDVLRPTKKPTSS